MLFEVYAQADNGRPLLEGGPAPCGGRLHLAMAIDKMQATQEG